jgi:hypothetical protein
VIAQQPLSVGRRRRRGRARRRRDARALARRARRSRCRRASPWRSRTTRRGPASWPARSASDTPRETACETLEEARAAFAALGGRAVFKSRFEAGRKILRYVKTDSQVAAAYDHVQKLSGAGPLVQEHVRGDGLGLLRALLERRPHAPLHAPAGARVAALGRDQRGRRERARGAGARARGRGAARCAEVARRRDGRGQAAPRRPLRPDGDQREVLGLARPRARGGGRLPRDLVALLEAARLAPQEP